MRLLIGTSLFIHTQRIITATEMLFDKDKKERNVKKLQREETKLSAEWKFDKNVNLKWIIAEEGWIKYTHRTWQLNKKRKTRIDRKYQLT